MEDKDRIPYGLLARYLTGETSAEEERAVGEWLEEDPSHAQVLAEASVAWGGAPAEALPSEEGVQAAWAQVQPKGSRHRWWPWLSGVAASLLLVLWWAWAWEAEPARLVFVNEDVQDLALVLPDGSQVLLRPEARVEYVEEGFGAHRQLWIEGNVMVERVAPGDLPMRIAMEGLLVESYEGQFYVEWEADGAENLITVAQGWVQLLPEEGAWSMVCRAGQQATVVPERQFVAVEETRNANYLTWYTGEMYLAGVTVPELLHQLAQELNLPLDSVDASLEDSVFTELVKDYDPNVLLFELLKRYNMEMVREPESVAILREKSI